MKKLFKIAPWLGALVLGLTILAGCVYPPLGPDTYGSGPYYSTYQSGYYAPGYRHHRYNHHWYRGHRGHWRWR